MSTFVFVPSVFVTPGMQFYILALGSVLLLYRRDSSWANKKKSGYPPIDTFGRHRPYSGLQRLRNPEKSADSWVDYLPVTGTLMAIDG